FPCAPLPGLLLALAAGLAPAAARAQEPVPEVLSELPEGQRIRTNGPAVREAVPLSVGDVLRGGLMTLLVRPPVEGVVVAAEPEALRFTGGGSEVVRVPWSGVDWVEAHRGRSPGIGTIQGAAIGALAGLTMWGVIELIFMAADNPVVDEPGIIIGTTAGAGALLGAATLGHRWE